MESKPQGIENKIEQRNTELLFYFSSEQEIKRIKNSISKITWYRGNGYKPAFPADLTERVENNEDISDEKIEQVLSTLYKKEEYEKFGEELQKQWLVEGESFIKKLATLGRPLCSSYKVSLTKYGVGGSYRLPNYIVINVSSNNQGWVFQTIKHEIIHLTIEELIQKYKIDHWVKERIVDLTFSRFFENERGVQNKENKMEEVSALFEEYFPDIEKIISEVGKIPKYVDKKGE